MFGYDLCRGWTCNDPILGEDRLERETFPARGFLTDFLCEL